jgi:hypothetical protein
MGLLDGLLGSSMDDPRTAMTLSIAQGLLSAPRAMQGLSGGLLAGQQAMQQAKQQKAAEEMRAMQMQHMALQFQEQKRAAEQAAMDRTLTQKAFTPVQPIEANAASGIAGPRPAALGAVGQQPAFDPRQYIASGGSADKAFALQQAMRKEQPKLSKMEAMRGPDGQLVNVAVFEDGTTKVLPYGVKPEMVFQDLGGKVAALDKNALQNGTTFGKSMTPGEIASNSLGRDRLSFDKTQAQGALTYQQDADGNFVGLPTRATPGSAVKATPVLAPGAGMMPLQGKGAGLTEDQGKATGWLVQAENAYKNMQGAMKASPGAERPGINDVIGAVPGFGGAANMMRGVDRQKFLQASSSFGEAVLRAATGAGVNKDEALQKARELTPQIGDKQDVIDQKMAAFPLYIESLKVRAGPGARKAVGIGASAGLPPDIADLLGKYGH